MGEFVAACKAANAEITAQGTDSYYAPGAAWNWFVCQLGAFFQTVTGEPPTAGKKQSKVSGFNPSPFVRFVHAVQSQLPRQFWQHPKASGRNPLPASMTLSDAVAKALSGRRAVGPNELATVKE